MKIGIFGGSFNPPHLGHINCAQTILKLAGLNQIRIMVSNQSPLKPATEGPSAELRLEMAKLAFSNWGSQFVVDDSEIKRKGTSYTVDTIKDLKKKFPEDELFLIIGQDQLEKFDQWKKSEQILDQVNLIVASRPGHDLPKTSAELPKVIQGLIAEQDFNFIELKNGKSIQFIKLKDVSISSTQLRKWLRVGKNVEKFVPLAVENYIRSQKIYLATGDRIGDFERFTKFSGEFLASKKAIAVKAFDLRSQSGPTEFALIASGTSTKHAASLAENTAQAIKEEYNIHPLSVEGLGEGRWVVLDYGALIIHVFYDFVRQEYALEKIWQGAPEIQIIDPTEASAKTLS